MHDLWGCLVFEASWGFAALLDGLGTAEGFLEFDIHGFPRFSAALGTNIDFLKIDIHDLRRAWDVIFWKPAICA